MSNIHEFPNKKVVKQDRIVSGPPYQAECKLAQVLIPEDFSGQIVEKTLDGKVRFCVLFTKMAGDVPVPHYYFGDQMTLENSRGQFVSCDTYLIVQNYVYGEADYWVHMIPNIGEIEYPIEFAVVSSSENINDMMGVEFGKFVGDEQHGAIVFRRI